MHVQSNRTRTPSTFVLYSLHLWHPAHGISMYIYILIKVVQKHESHLLGFQIMPFTENTLPLANMCLVIHGIHVMGKLFNIMKELSY